jgi:hypothetical protein
MLAQNKFRAFHIHPLYDFDLRAPHERISSTCPQH